METTQNVVKFTTEELETIKNLQQKYYQKTMVFGQIQLERFGVNETIKDLQKNLSKLDDAEEKTKQEYLTVQKEETDFLTKITDKYGEGSLNMENGTFAPTPKKT